MASPHSFSLHSSEVFGLSTCRGEVAFTKMEGSEGGAGLVGKAGSLGWNTFSMRCPASGHRRHDSHELRRECEWRRVRGTEL